MPACVILLPPPETQSHTLARRERKNTQFIPLLYCCRYCSWHSVWAGRQSKNWVKYPFYTLAFWEDWVYATVAILNFYCIKFIGLSSDVIAPAYCFFWRLMIFSSNLTPAINTGIDALFNVLMCILTPCKIYIWLLIDWRHIFWRPILLGQLDPADSMTFFWCQMCWSPRFVVRCLEKI